MEIYQGDKWNDSVLSMENFFSTKFTHLQVQSTLCILCMNLCNNLYPLGEPVDILCLKISKLGFSWNKKVTYHTFISGWWPSASINLKTFSAPSRSCNLQKPLIKFRKVFAVTDKPFLIISSNILTGFSISMDSSCKHAKISYQKNKVMSTNTMY